MKNTIREYKVTSVVQEQYNELTMKAVSPVQAVFQYCQAKHDYKKRDLHVYEYINKMIVQVNPLTSIDDIIREERELLTAQFTSKEEVAMDEDIKSYTGKICEIYTVGGGNSVVPTYSYAIYDEDGVLVQDGLGDLKNASAEVRKSGNIAGELKAIMLGVVYAKQNNLDLMIHYNYKGIGSWLKGDWKAKSAASKMFLEFMEKNKGIYVSCDNEKRD